MTDLAKPTLPEIDALGAEELRALVRAYHATLQAVILDNNAFSFAQQQSNAIWSKQVNERLSALFSDFRANTKPSTQFQ